MVLSDAHIKKYIQEGLIKVVPPPDFDKQLNPCSLDLRLGDSFKVFRYSARGHIDIKEVFDPEEMLEDVKIDLDKPFFIQPGELVLATTYETLEIPENLMARLDGRSSLGRIGIIVHGTAGVFHPGWRGKPTLELVNLGRIAVALYPMWPICSLTFHQLSCPAEVPYAKRTRSKYVDEMGPSGSKLWMDQR